MPKYTEEDVQAAIQDVIGGMSARKAAEKWGIASSTLSNRLRGKSSRKEAFQTMQRLSHAQERNLCGWVVIQDVIGQPATRQQIRDVAGRIAVQNGDTKPIGKNWIEGFYQRYPDARPGRGKKRDRNEAGIDDATESAAADGRDDGDEDGGDGDGGANRFIAATFAVGAL